MSDIEGALQSLNDDVARLPTGEDVERMMSEAMDGFGQTHIQKYNDSASTLETTMIRREQRAEERLRQAYEQADRARKETHSARIAFKDQEIQSLREALAQKSNEILVLKDSSQTKPALIVELTQFQVSKSERIAELTSLDQTQSETIHLLQNGDEELRSALSSRDTVIQNLQASNTQAKDEADLAASLANERAQDLQRQLDQLREAQEDRHKSPNGLSELFHLLAEETRDLVLSPFVHRDGENSLHGMTSLLVDPRAVKNLVEFVEKGQDPGQQCLIEVSLEGLSARRLDRRGCLTHKIHPCSKVYVNPEDNQDGRGTVHFTP
ncbi:hypothetical protein NM208_g14651 [Fusarium decemcellulare]|uniref:Uncharacterized protein n=1 Tax=Fusarium decemcellulare TaxID=57161 RepID=A0ACC1RFX2_9HYPO|nr:hypothetical protein NM208_g14651 [Fusarium decemcellulare]